MRDEPPTAAHVSSRVDEFGPRLEYLCRTTVAHPIPDVRSDRASPPGAQVLGRRRRNLGATATPRIGHDATVRRVVVPLPVPRGARMAVLRAGAGAAPVLGETVPAQILVLVRARVRATISRGVTTTTDVVVVRRVATRHDVTHVPSRPRTGSVHVATTRLGHDPLLGDPKAPDAPKVVVGPGAVPVAVTGYRHGASSRNARLPRSDRWR